MGTNAARDRARSALARLAGAGLDNDSFRHEAAGILRRAVGFDGWCWVLEDPGARLTTRELGENMIVDQDWRRFLRLLPESGEEEPISDRRRPWRPAPRGAPPVTVLSAQTGGDLCRDLSWREIFGPAGSGDKMRAVLSADGTCWATLHLNRDSSGPFYGEEDAEFVSGVVPLLATRLRAGLRALGPPYDPAPQPGTIILDQDLSLVAATEQAWRWIDRLGLPQSHGAEPLPGVVYVVAMHVATAPERPARPARVRLQAADGHWTVVRAAPLITGSAAPAGYAVTVESARSEDLTPLLMRAWSLSPREREVARLVIDGMPTEDIATTLFISMHTVNSHLKTIFGKLGVSRRQDLITALAGTSARTVPA